MDDAAAAVTRFRGALAAADAEAVRLALHPYLHWSGVDGRVVRGRKNVLAMLAAVGLPDPPATVELRDGQIYRWVS